MEHKFYYRKGPKMVCLGILLALVTGLAYMGIMISCYMLGIMGALVGLYVLMIYRAAIVITSKSIRLDFSAPLPWSYIRYAQIKTVYLCGKPKKILSLVTDKKIPYSYSFLQRHNGAFGPFPIPLYGLLSSADEAAILSLIRQHVPVKKGIAKKV